MNLNIVIGGEAGQGLQTVEEILGKSFFRMGYHVYSTKDYMSRVRGGHNFMQIRIGNEPITGPTEAVDLLIALNEESVEIHKERVKTTGCILFDGEIDAGAAQVISLPAMELAAKINPKGVNTIFIGAVLRLLGFNLTEAAPVVRAYFGTDQLIADNLSLLQAGYDTVESRFTLPPVLRNPEEITSEPQMYITGNQAVGLGAAFAGVQFYSAYPMSPSTGVMNYLATKQDRLGIVVEQVEDEISAIMMALGASYGGVRSMTGTSGGGFCLMTEGLGLAGVSETPIVIINVQRPGPATGLPTRTEQGDLLFVLNASQGEFPRVVIAPRDQEDAFYQTFRAFNLADKYQLPVIILTDQFLGDTAKNFPAIDYTGLKIERHLATPEEVSSDETYARYKFTDTGISPRIYPGQYSGYTTLVDSHEHTERGKITEDKNLRKCMVEKRAQKLKTLAEQDLLEPLYFGDEEIDFLLVCWGSTYGPLKEAQQLLKADGYKVGLLSYSDIWPLATEELCKRASGRKVVVIELNSTAQFARLLRGETGLRIDATILKYDGRPFTGQEIYERMKEEVMG